MVVKAQIKLFSKIGLFFYKSHWQLFLPKVLVVDSYKGVESIFLAGIESEESEVPVEKVADPVLKGAHRLALFFYLIDTVVF